MCTLASLLVFCCQKKNLREHHLFPNVRGIEYYNLGLGFKYASKTANVSLGEVMLHLGGNLPLFWGRGIWTVKFCEKGLLRTKIICYYKLMELSRCWREKGLEIDFRSKWANFQLWHRTLLLGRRLVTCETLNKALLQFTHHLKWHWPPTIDLKMLTPVLWLENILP